MPVDRLKTASALGWGAVVLYVASQAAGVNLMFHYRPAPTVNTLDVANIRASMPLQHWAHLLAGSAAGLGFFAFAALSSGRRLGEVGAPPLSATVRQRKR